ncbi:protein kinase domain-containing protein [Methylomagnum sp.]
MKRGAIRDDARHYCPRFRKAPRHLPPAAGGPAWCEYLPGGTLAERLEREGPLATAEVWRCLAELAEGLAFLHGAGRIHCDLKPDNAFLHAHAGTALISRKQDAGWRVHGNQSSRFRSSSSGSTSVRNRCSRK